MQGRRDLGGGMKENAINKGLVNSTIRDKTFGFTDVSKFSIGHHQLKLPGVLPDTTTEESVDLARIDLVTLEARSHH